MSKTKWGKYLWQLLIAIIPVPITIWLTVLYVQDRGEVRNLECTREVREGFINLPKALSSKIQLSYDGNPVDNLSSVTYKVFNRTGRSFQDVKLFFEFDTDDAIAQLLSKDIKGPENYPKDGFQELETKSSSIGWSLDTMNPSDSLLDTFEISFVFLGPKAPDVDIAVLKTGVDLGPLGPSQSSQLGEVLYIVAMVIGGLLYVTFLILMFKYGRLRRSRFVDTLKAELTGFFENKSDKITNVESKDLAQDVVDIYSETLRQRKDPFVILISWVVKRIASLARLLKE